MDFDELRKAWQEQRPPDDGPYNEKRFRRMVDKMHSFNGVLAHRDAGEIGAAMLLGVLTLAGSFFLALHAWVWVLAAACQFGVGLYIVVDRLRRREAPAEDNVRESLERALREVDHQAQLLRSVALWYLLPYGLSMAMVLGDMWLRMAVIVTPIKDVSFLLIVVILLGSTGYVYWLNQWAVKYQLLPLRRELEEALSDLNASA
jgi:hypothetical protein